MKFIKKTDIIIISAVVFICMVSLVVYKIYNSSSSVLAQIYYRSQLVETFEIKKGTDRIFSISQNDKVVFHLYPDGSICFQESDCRDKICVRSGKLNMIGQTAACLPNQIILKIVRNDRNISDDNDIIIGFGN